LKLKVYDYYIPTGRKTTGKVFEPNPSSQGVGVFKVIALRGLSEAKIIFVFEWGGLGGRGKNCLFCIT
jgi:hypothetical protein